MSTGAAIRFVALLGLVAMGCRSDNRDRSSVRAAERPATPRILSPAHGHHTGSVRSDATALRPVFTWTPIEASSVTYDLDIDDGCSPGALPVCPFTRPLIRQRGVSDDHWQPDEPLPVNAELPIGRRYFWRLRACIKASCSPWTRVRSLEVGRTRGDLNGDGYSDVVVSAPLIDNGGRDRGSVFVYYGTSTGIGISRRLDEPGDGDEATFGVSVAIAGDVDGDGFADLLVGAAGAREARGAVHVFYGSATGVSPQRTTRLADRAGVTADWFGAAVASAGDVDADGFADILVGASGTDRAATDVGVAHVYRGGPEGIDREPLMIAVPSPSDFDHFAFALTGAGDVDGDGYDDIAIGSPGIDVAGEIRGVDRGAVYIFYGSSDGVLRTAARRLEAPVPLDDDHFGYAVAGAGDLDADGFADVVVGAPGSDEALSDSGTVYVFRGGPRGAAESATVLHDLRVELYDRFGTAVAGVGDVDRDGYSDIAVGTSGSNRGRGLIYRGGPEGVAGRPTSVLIDPLGNGRNGFAAALAGAGDVNGDGYDDLVVGAAGAANGGVFRGSVLLYPGHPTGIDHRSPLRLDDPDEGHHDHYGRSVAGR